MMKKDKLQKEIKEKVNVDLKKDEAEKSKVVVKEVNDEKKKQTEKKKETVVEKDFIEIDPVVKKNMNLKKALAIIIFFSVVTIGFLLYLKTNIDVTNQNIIATVSFSILFNVMILFVLFATGMGQDIVGRLKRKILFGTGRYVNVLYISKNGPVKEFFRKVDKVTGKFKILDNSYVRNPSLLHLFKKIPTYIHREGNPDPVNVFANGLTSDISNNEIDIVMSSAGVFDFKLWLQNNALYIFIGIFIIITAAAVSAYMGFSVLQMLRDGTYAAVQCIPQVVEIAASTGL